MALPSGYKRLLYIESTGTQWVDTEVYVTPDNYQNVRFEVDCEKVGKGNGSLSTDWLLDGASAAENFYVGVARGVTYYGCGAGDVSTGLTYPGGRCTFVLDTAKKTYSVTGLSDVSITVDAFTASVPIALFAWVDGQGNRRPNAQKTYGSKTSIGGSAVRDYIPCETNTGDIGLWDDVYSKFYGNAGSGKFIAGPMVDPMTPHDGHNTNIGSVAYEVNGVIALIGGVLREVEIGKTLLGGVGRDIVFERVIPEPEPTVGTITLTGTGVNNVAYATFNGTTAYSGTYEYDLPLALTVRIGGGPGAWIKVNGETVKSGGSYGSALTYSITTESKKVSIVFSREAPYGQYYYRADVTIE